MNTSVAVVKHDSSFVTSVKALLLTLIALSCAVIVGVGVLGMHEDLQLAEARIAQLETELAIQKATSNTASSCFNSLVATPVSESAQSISNAIGGLYAKAKEAIN